MLLDEDAQLRGRPSASLFGVTLHRNRNKEKLGALKKSHETARIIFKKNVLQRSC